MTIHALVVDNNPVHLKAVSSILAKEGCEVSVACNGLEALEILQRSNPDIIFTDLVMPMVDGEQLCKIVRGIEEYKNIFLVVLSAIILEDRDRILSEIDCDVCIAKGTLPEIRENLRETLTRFKKKDNIASKILGVKGGEEKAAPSSVMKELLLEKEHLSRMLENLSEGIVELSHSGKIVSINKAAIGIWECSREEVIAQKFENLSLGNHTELIRKWCREQLEELGGGNLEIQEGDPLKIGGKVLTASLLPVLHNDVYFAICIFRDITRQYFAEQKKEETDNAIKLVKKMEAMSCMAGGVAHDFNNLLTVICGNIDMISIDNDQKDENIKYLENARLSAYSAVELVGKISNFSPFGIIQRKDYFFHEFVETVVNDFFKEKNLTEYKVNILEENSCVNIDSAQIKTAIINILQNAIESGSDENIEVTVDRETIEVPNIRSGQYLPPGDYGKITVRDGGRGVDSENLHAIFDPYFSTKERGSLKGMGLGLTIVYSTFRNHGGYVVVESEKNVGTTVSLFLPIYFCKNTRQSATQKGKTILLVEGDTELRAISKIMLEFLEYSVLDAKNRKEALQYFKADRVGGKKISVAIVNLSEEGKRDGVETCTDLHAIDSDLNVIISSGSIFDPIMRDFKEFGFVATLGKPYTLDDLKKTLFHLF